LLIYSILPHLIFKVDNKVFVKTQFFKTIKPSKKLSKKYLRSYKIISQPSTLLFTLYLLKSMYSVHLVFHVSIFELAIFNTFSERTQSTLVLVLVIINGESEYKILQIVDSKINHQQACKLLYKIIWLKYEDTKDKSKQFSTTELTYTINLVSNFYITYPTKFSSLSLL